MPTDQTGEGFVNLEQFRSSLREITHELNNPLGVIRMAAYFLEHSEAADPDKREQYFKIINQSLDKAEEVLKKLRALREKGLSA
jgi:signal transduction histidine kinase